MRHPPRPASAGSQDVDDDIRALMADIDASMAELEQRLGGCRRTDERPAAKPEPDVQARSSTPEASGDLLAELAQEAAQKAGENQDNWRDREARDRRLHEALARTFKFFSQFSRHANQIEPRITRPYRLDPQTGYTDLKWQGAFADSRKRDLSDNAYLAHVSFRVRLIAPQPVVVTRRWDQVQALRDELHILDLRVLDEPTTLNRPLQENVSLGLAPEFPLQMGFRANYEQDRIDVLCRNLEGFGIAAFVLDPDEANQALLDGIGRFLLGRSPQLPAALRRVHYHSDSSLP